MCHGRPLRPENCLSTDILWWNSTTSICEKVEGARFDECLNHFREYQGRKTRESDFSIDVVILIEEPVTSEKGEKTIRLSITKGHYSDLITTFGLSSFERRNLFNTGYHHYVEENPGIHEESPLIIAVQSPRLRVEDHFFTMRISPNNNSTTCIITVPTKDVRDRLRAKISYHHHAIMTCPVYLFNMLCERLDYSNETITSDIFKEFEELEVEMNKFCVEAQKFDSPEKYCKPPNEDEMYKEHMKAMFRFNVVNKGLMILECTIDFELSALGFAKSVMGRYTKLCAASNPPNNLPRMSDENLQVFDNKVESLQTAARLRQTMRASVQQRAEFMVSLLRGSNSQRDTLYNLRISKNSRNLTILGSLFIPPTLVATVFGTNVFSMNPQTRNLEVASLWWTLLASAGGLTLLVIFLMAVCVWSGRVFGNSKSGCPRSGSSRSVTESASTPV